MWGQCGDWVNKFFTHEGCEEVSNAEEVIRMNKLNTKRQLESEKGGGACNYLDKGPENCLPDKRVGLDNEKGTRC